MSFNVIHENKILAKFFEFTNMQTLQSLCCSHAQILDKDENSDQNLASCSAGYIPWIHQHGRLKEAFAHMG